MCTFTVVAKKHTRRKTRRRRRTVWCENGIIMDGKGREARKGRCWGGREKEKDEKEE